ncbi:MAG: phenylalanine--tRNA ligase beta subunit-related protein [bacterium]|nr:phenylalanine--tRNA ligase beta subunit-related protein [bacterium]
MKISREWLQTYFEKELPKVEEIARGLTMHAFEIEGTKKLNDDEILDVKILPNRAHDCLSYYGIAKEVSAIFEIPLTKKLLSGEVRNLPQSNEFSVEIESQKVKRFKVAVIHGVKVAESPKWLKKRIEAMGGKSINNIVDITNFVMFEIGQPMHAFDADKLKKDNGPSFIIRDSLEGEKITTLDGVERTLKEGAILITDGGDEGKTILGIAGIKGGAQTEITEKTKNIILEAATFDAPTIRKHAKLLNIRTDASIRFENGIAPELPTFAIDYTIKLIEENAHGENFQVEGEFDYYPEKLSRYKIGVSLKEMNDLLGTRLTNKETEQIFNRLQFKHREVDPEEVLKEYINKVVGKKYKANSAMRRDAPEIFSCSSLASYLFAEGGIYMPSISIDKYVYGDEVKEDELKFGDLIFANTKEGKIYFETVEYMKGKKVPDGIDHVGIYVGNNEVLHATRSTGTVVREKIKDSKQFQNIVGYRRMGDLSEKRFVAEVPFERLDLRIKEDLIEEIGRIYGLEHIDSVLPKPLPNEPEINEEFYKCQKIREVLINDGYSEVYTYAMVNKGEVEIENPIASDKNFMRPDFSEGMLKAVTLSMQNARLLNIKEIKIFEIGKIFKKESNKINEELKVVVINTKINPIYTKSSITDFYKIEEYTLKDAYEKYGKKESAEVLTRENIKYIPISPYPFALRDVAVFVPESVKSEEVEKIIRDNAGEYLVRCDQFDEFKKDGKISYAFHLVFQSNERTLTEKELNESMEKVTKALNNKLNWQVR